MPSLAPSGIHAPRFLFHNSPKVPTIHSICHFLICSPKVHHCCEEVPSSLSTPPPVFKSSPNLLVMPIVRYIQIIDVGEHCHTNFKICNPLETHIHSDDSLSMFASMFILHNLSLNYRFSWKLLVIEILFVALLREQICIDRFGRSF